MGGRIGKGARFLGKKSQNVLANASFKQKLAAKRMIAGDIKGGARDLFLETVQKEGKPVFDKVYKRFVSYGIDKVTGKFGGKAAFFKEIMPPDSQTNGKENLLISMDQNSKLLQLGTEKIQIFPKKVETGVPSSKTLLEQAVENGTSTNVLYDSSTAAVGDNYYYLRPQLNTGSGFGQRGFTMLGRPSYVTYRDVLQFVDTANLQSAWSEKVRQSALAAILHTRFFLRIRNQAAFQRAKVKVHLLKYSPSSLSSSSDYATDMIQNVFWPNINNQSTTAEERQRKVNFTDQFTNTSLVGAPSTAEGLLNYTGFVAMDTRGPGLMSSGHFKEYYKIVHTSEQILGPGDFMHFTHIHNFGSGIDISKLMGAGSSIDQDKEKEVSYVYLLEYKGMPCEAIYNNPTTGLEQRIGIGPTLLSFEMEKQITFVNAPTSNRELGPIGFATDCLIRVFSHRDVQNSQEGSLRRPFNLPVQRWSNSGSPASGNFGISQMTDRAFLTTVHQAGPGPVTDLIP